jgi:hypothetical protein
MSSTLRRVYAVQGAPRAPIATPDVAVVLHAHLAVPEAICLVVTLVKPHIGYTGYCNCSEEGLPWKEQEVLPCSAAAHTATQGWCQERRGAQGRRTPERVRPVQWKCGALQGPGNAGVTPKLHSETAPCARLRMLPLLPIYLLKS